MVETTTEKPPKFGRAFNAAVSHDWAITQEGLYTVLRVAARLNPPQAVEAYDSPELEYTRVSFVRNGVAIIPVDGPIFRYSSFFTRYSGGTSVDDLAKD